MIYGPFEIFTYDPSGAVTDIPASGVHYTTDLDSYAQHEAVLGPYRVQPAHPLQSVMAGDNPAAPVLTVALRFPDQATASSVAAQMA